MRRRLILAATVVAALAATGEAPASAGDAAGSLRPSASSSSVLFGIGGSGTAISLTQIPVHIRGGLAVQFHGDQATGCAARGLCGFSGTVIWQPPSTATLEADTFREHGRNEYDVSLDFLGNLAPGGPPVQGGVTTADVRFAPNGAGGSPSTCTDAAVTGADIEMPVHLRAASLTLAAAEPSVLATRCAAPLQSDIANQLARRVVDVASLSHGQIGVSLASSSDFAVHGLAGTVTSTIQLRLGRPHTQRASTQGSSPKQPKVRTVQVEYSAHLNASVLIRTHGDPTSCAQLGSCGANGTFALRVHSRPGKLLLFAFAGARRPLRDELAALGLRKHGNPRGILIAGAFLVRGPTSYAVDVTQGAHTCKDTGPAGPGVFLLEGTGGSVSATFSQGPPVLHLRCPGPIISQDNGFASASVRIARLRHGGTIHLRTVRNLRDDGYTVRTSANVAMTLAPPKVKITTDALRSPNPG
ncbi:MAG: hypothetical protein ACXVHJ_21710 [Solirubrobacteraceae bacterium]